MRRVTAQKAKTSREKPWNATLDAGKEIDGSEIFASNCAFVPGHRRIAIGL
jgi:hypothetical protein